jgi:hypothetical protein
MFLNKTILTTKQTLLSAHQKVSFSRHDMPQFEVDVGKTHGHLLPVIL